LPVSSPMRTRKTLCRWRAECRAPPLPPPYAQNARARMLEKMRPPQSRGKPSACAGAQVVCSSLFDHPHHHPQEQKKKKTQIRYTQMPLRRPTSAHTRCFCRAICLSIFRESPFRRKMQQKDAVRGNDRRASAPNSQRRHAIRRTPSAPATPRAYQMPPAATSATVTPAPGRYRKTNMRLQQNEPPRRCRQHACCAQRCFRVHSRLCGKSAARR